MKIRLAFLLLISVAISGCEKLLIGTNPENSAKSNFNILWKTFDENYALFGVRHINWDSLKTVYEARISDQTSESELWEISCDLISNLNDGHVCLLSKGWDKWAQSNYILRTRMKDDFSLNLVKTKYIQYIKTAGECFITYGHVRNQNIGYIHISTFGSSGVGNNTDWAYDIDKAIDELSGTDAMIVDVRNNTGGLILTQNIISSAFTDHKITFFYSRRKTGPGHNDFGEQRPLSISPRPGKVPYSKKIAFLTNRFTVSGGEYMTQIFKNLPNSTQIGDTTLGAFGEITNMSELPNGWTFTYPCTLTTLPDGTCPEGSGLLPDVLVENTSADIDAGKDNVMDYAIKYLTR